MVMVKDEVYFCVCVFVESAEVKQKWPPHPPYDSIAVRDKEARPQALPGAGECGSRAGG